jgi:hypothetical protein
MAVGNGTGAWALDYVSAWGFKKEHTGLRLRHLQIKKAPLGNIRATKQITFFQQDVSTGTMIAYRGR